MQQVFGLKDKWPQLTLCLILIGLAFMGYRLWYAEMLRVHYVDGFCPRGTWPQNQEGVTIPGHTVILIDTSDRISSEVGDSAFQRIDEWARDTIRAPFLQKVSIYGLPESEEEIPIVSGQPWCIPRQGVMANRLYENPRVVEIEFRRFLQGVKAELDSLIDRDQADQSPIVETMSWLTQQHEDLDSFVMISDMLQHSDLASHYVGYQEITPALRDVCDRIVRRGMKSIEVYYVDRTLDLQGNLWPTGWWSDCLGNLEQGMMN